MGIHKSGISTDALLEQAGWLTALARRLVRDPSEADDVAQETLMTALSSSVPPQRPWLARVARNVARMRARSETARVHREGSMGPSAAAPSAAELAERLEAQRLLVEAVRDLGEPYRATVLLHYWEHKTSEEIAAIQGIPAGTVRWRLKHGVDSLRERLDARHGGNRRAWSAMLAPLAAPVPVGALVTTSILGGLFGMKLVLQGAVAAVVLVAVGAGVWLTQRQEPLDAAPTVSSERAETVLEDPVKVPSVVPELEKPDEGARRLASAPSPVRETADIVPLARVEARILAESGRPIPGALLEELYGDDSSLPPADDAGRVAGNLDVRDGERSATFRLSAAAHATRVLSANLNPGRTTFLGDVVLSPGGAISGRIIDLEMRPIGGASVGIVDAGLPKAEMNAHRDSRFVGEPNARSGPDGSFRIQGVAVGSCRVVSFSPAHAGGFSAPVEVHAGQETPGVEIELSPLPADRIVRGIVLDPEGRPVPNAEVGFHYVTADRTSSSGSFHADEKGRFDEITMPRAKVSLYARSPQPDWSDAAAVDVRGSEKDIVLQFGKSRSFEVAVRSTTGEPIEEWEAAFRPPAAGSTLGLIRAGKHALGVAKAPIPAAKFVVMVEARGFAPAQVGPFDPATVASVVSVEMKPVPGIIGRVLSANGPVAGAEVSVFLEAEQRVVHNGFVVAVEPSPLDRAVTSDDGSFVLVPNEGGNLIVRADKEPFASAEIMLHKVDARRGTDGVELRLTEGGSIVGRVLPERGREATGAVVAVSRGDGFARTQRVGPDGAFAFERLMPGRWNVTRRESELDPQSSSWSMGNEKRPEMPWNCEVLEGQVTKFDVGENETAPCALVGRLVVSGAELGRWTAMLPAEQGPVTAPLDASGSFRLESSEPGPTHVILTAIEGPFEGTHMRAPIDLSLGETRWSADISAARIALHGTGTASKSPLAFVIARKDRSIIVRGLPDEGDLQLVVPEGKGRIMRLDPESVAGPDPSQWVGGKVLETDADETVRVERP
jgi:RNA polymerase sigma factor (sigma-70 family)